MLAVVSGGGVELNHYLFYGLHANPFNITPDPHYLYLTEASRKALEALRYGVEARKGFVVMLGEVGTGKTTLLRTVLATLDPTVRRVLVFHPRMTFVQLLEYVLSELGLPVTARTKLGMLQTLQAYLLEQLERGHTVALLIDEAQDIDVQVLEDLRLLSNMETETDKVVQLVLCGQPELETKLQDPRLRQLRQRVAVTARLHGLAPPEVRAYLERRLEKAGSGGRRVFRRGAVRMIARLSHGNPRQINLICDHALRLGATRRHRHIGRALVLEGHALLLPGPPPSLQRRAVQWSGHTARAAALLLLAAGAGGALALMTGDGERLVRAVRTSASRGARQAAIVPTAVSPASPTPARRDGRSTSRAKPARPRRTTVAARPAPAAARADSPTTSAPAAATPERAEGAPLPRTQQTATPAPREPAKRSTPRTVESVAALERPDAEEKPAKRPPRSAGGGQAAPAGEPEEREDRSEIASDPAGAEPVPAEAVPLAPRPTVARSDSAAGSAKRLAPSDGLALLERFRHRVEAQDLDGLEKLLSADVVQDKSQGRAAVLRDYAALFDRSQRIRYTLRPILVHQMGDRIFIKGEARLEVEGRPSRSRTATWWLERTDSGLQISRLSHFRPAEPAEAGPPPRSAAPDARPTGPARAQSAPTRRDR